jgi:hypothetical protein
MLAATPVDYAILNALARYRLLSVSQAERIGIARRWHLGDRLRSLETAGLVSVIRRGRMLGPNVYSLTPKGASTLEAWAAEDGETRTIGVRRSPFRLGPHLVQRLAIVDVHIALREWAEASGGSVDEVRMEYDPNPNSLEPATSIMLRGARYTPDGLLAVTDSAGEAWLFVLEVETGGPSNSLDNFRAHLPERLDVFERDVLEDAVGWPETCRAARLLFVFQTPDMLLRAIRLIGRSDREVWKRVFFNSLPSVVAGFANGWVQVDGSQGSPFREIRAP